MMTTRVSCRLNCLICHLSVSRVLAARLVQVSGVSCVSHDAVRLVPGPRALPVSRATMKCLNASSVPASGVFPSPLRHSLSQQSAPGLSLTYLTRSLCPTLCPLWRASFLMTIHDVLVAKILNQDSLCIRNNLLRVISVIRCSERCECHPLHVRIS